jgi:hypothetical protein
VKMGQNTNSFVHAKNVLDLLINREVLLAFQCLVLIQKGDLVCIYFLFTQGHSVLFTIKNLP